jgi:hypothetical protein
MRPPRTTPGLVILTLLAVCAGACAGRRRPALPDMGITVCPARAAHDLLAVDALQCWFTARYGRWRTLSHESHYAVLVVEVEAADIRDADGIARQFVDAERASFSEILLYVQHAARSGGAAIRRVRWTTDRGFESIDFNTAETGDSVR